MLIKPSWPLSSSIKAFCITRMSDIEQVALPDTPCWLKQVHGSQVVELSNWQPDCNADASFTLELQKICVVKTADCLPILLANKAGTIVAAIHAGWRGLSQGVLEQTVKALNTDNTTLYAWLGPAISQKHFEVGEDVLTAFAEQHFDTDSYFKKANNNKWFADIYGLARQRLTELGITKVYGGEYCTYEQTDLFYSHRRSKDTGRMASLIWLE